MASTFAALYSDGSDSDVESVPTTPTRKPQAKPFVSGYATTTLDASFGAEDSEFCPVNKKKSHNMKVVTGKNMVQSVLSDVQNTPVTPTVVAPAVSQESPIVTPNKEQPLAQQATPAERKEKRGKRKPVNNSFACFDDDEDASDASDDDFTPVTRVEPVLPKHLGLFNRDSVADYFGVVHTASTSKPERDVMDELKKPFKSEIISLNVVFVSSKTRKAEFEFKKYVRPTDFPEISQQTVDMTGITTEKLVQEGAQPLDEVLREFDRFLKEKGLVSCNRNNKRRATANISDREMEFLIVSDGVSGLNEMVKELVRKGQQPQPHWKKWFDLRQAFTENYNIKAANLQEMLQHICQEFEGVPHVDDAKNVGRVLAVMLGDCPGKIEVNAHAKGTK